MVPLSAHLELPQPSGGHGVVQDGHRAEAVHDEGRLAALGTVAEADDSGAPQRSAPLAVTVPPTY